MSFKSTLFICVIIYLEKEEREGVIMEIKNINNVDDEMLSGKTNQDKEVKQEVMSNDFLRILDNVITKGEFTKTYNIAEGLEVEFRVLGIGESLIAESRVALNPTLLPEDITLRARNLSMLAEATVSLNGVPIKRDDLSKAENRNRVDELYKKYLDMPPTLIDTMYNKYRELIKEQNDFYSKPSGEIEKDLENF